MRALVLLPVLLSATCASAVCVVTGHDWMVWHGISDCVVNTSFTVWLVFKGGCSRAFSEGIIAWLFTSYVVVWNWQFYDTIDGWSLSIVAADLLLLCGARRGVVNVLSALSVTYITVIGLECTLSFGLFDVANTSIANREECECSWYTMAARLVTFVLDLGLTRYFAFTMQDEQERMHCTVEMAHRVARAMVRFDLDQADLELRDGRISGELQEAMKSLLQNLRTYRPYLPESLFEAEWMGDEASIVTPQMKDAPRGEVAMVFTDIEASSPLWEACPAAMKKAMQTHNAVIRTALLANGGYEVKTIGDAFMVAFEGVTEAARFCLAVQEGLYLSEWPEELLQQPLCYPEEGLWNGLRVRMGLHVGEAELEVNPVTGRADYFGPNVNIAARVEGKALGGTVAVTREAFSRLSMEDLDWPAVREKGREELRGVGRAYDVCIMAPSALGGRVDVTEVRKVSATVVNTPSLRWQHSTDMRVVHGTVGHVRLDHTVDTWRGDVFDSLLSTVADAVDRTQGVLLTVTGSMILAGWNLGKRLPGHAVQAAVMAGHVSRGVKGVVPNGYVTMGLVSGSLLHGSVGTQSQRFVIGVGECFNVAGELALSALDMQAFALVTAQPGYSSVANMQQADRVTRAVDKCIFQNTEVDVYHLRVDVVEDWAKGRDVEASERWILPNTPSFPPSPPDTIAGYDEDACSELGYA